MRLIEPDWTGFNAKSISSYRGLAYLCATTTFGCLALRDFRMVSTTDDDIRRRFLPSAGFRTFTL